MNKVRVAINGFGRIGRTTTRALLSNPNIQIIAINDLSDAYTLAHLFKYDSIHGIYKGEISSTEKEIKIDNQNIQIFAEKDIENLPWAKLDIDIVIEATGRYRTKKLANKHIIAGAKKVILSAPAKGSEAVPMAVYQINHQDIKAEDIIISNASCTTNCAAPMVKIIDDLCQIENGYLLTVHSFTSDQRIHDAPHKDIRRARSATQSIIPTTTGAANAILKIFPHLEGKIKGSAIRVPVPNGSLTELTLNVKNSKSVQEINQAFFDASKNEYSEILAYTDEPLVSTDIIGMPYSCIFDSQLTTTIGNMIKITAWYDNEMGYSHRLADLVKYISNFS